jgi:hypothetical protein
MPYDAMIALSCQKIENRTNDVRPSRQRHATCMLDFVWRMRTEQTEALFAGIEEYIKLALSIIPLRMLFGAAPNNTGRLEELE